MNWWTKRAQIDSYDDRNRFNEVARRLTIFAESLRYAAKLVYMTGRGARAMVNEIAEHKTTTSYPLVQDVLKQADRICLDSPQRFSTLCLTAAQLFENAVAEIEEVRHEFVQDELPRRMKGLVDDE